MCPLCSGRLGIYQDTIHQGQWLYCEDCQEGGDPIMFAAKFWEVPVAAAARRLLEEATPEDLERYETMVIQGYAKLEAFWAGARQYLLASPDLRSLRLNLGISPTLQAESWSSRGGKYLGGCTRREVEALVGYEGRRSIFWGHGQTYGPNWVRDDRFISDMMVVPFYDLPGRISSLLFVTKTGRSGEDYTYYPVLPLQERARRRVVPGVFGLDLLFRPLDFGGDLALILLDPLLAVRLLVRHWADESTLLPVAAVWTESPPCPVLAATGRKAVVWGHQASLALFRHASALDARIALCSARLEDVHRQVQRRRPREWVERQVASARPWREVLEEHLASLAAADAEALLLQLELPKQRLKEFLEGCRPSVRTSLSDLYEARCTIRQVTINGREITEARGCWWSHNRLTPLSDALVRIEKVVHLANSDKTYCQGAVSYQGREVAFTAEKDVLEKHGWTWLSDFLIHEGLGVLGGSRWTGAPTVFAIATAFHRPEVTRGAERAGWDENVPGFTFPNFIVKVGGEVEANWAPWPKPSASHAPQPALHLEQPHGLSDSDLRLLAQSPAARLAWALTLTTLHNLLADVWGYAPRGLALCGPAQVAAVRLAEGLGCPRYVIARNTHNYWLRRGLAVDWNHGLPLILDGLASSSEAWMHWLAESQHNHAVLLPAATARLCTIYGGWLRLEAERPLEAPRELVETLGRLLPNYLQDLASRRLQTQSSSLEPLDRVTRDAADWIARLGGDSKTVWAGDRMLARDTLRDVGEAFADLLCRLLGEARLRFDRAGFVIRGRRAADLPPALVYFEEHGGTVWVPQAGVQGVLRSRRLPPLDITRVSQGLDAAGALVGEKDYSGQPGWLILESWWDGRLQAWRSQTSYRKATLL